MGRVLLAVAVVLMAALGAKGQSANIFDLPGSPPERPVRAIVMLGAERAGVQWGELAGAAVGSEMARLLSGRLAVLEGGEGSAGASSALARLRTCQAGRPRAEDRAQLESALAVCTVHIEGVAQQRRVQIVRTPDGVLMARALDAQGAAEPPAQAVLINQERWQEIVGVLPLYRGGFESPAADTEEDAERAVYLDEPLEAGWLTMDAPTLNARFGRRGSVRFDPAVRKLGQERIAVRLPRVGDRVSYDPRRPAALLVWISATNEGAVPEALHAALDRYNVIAIAPANIGNNRSVGDRIQLVLDGIATVSRRYHIDPQRVYISGFSGGGRVAAMMALCMPDVFAGAVPIVGLDSWENIPSGTVGGQVWAAAHSKPPPAMLRLLKDRRIAPVTGAADANYRKIIATARALSRDGVNVRIFEYAEMGHEMATPERFAEAFSWVDGPAQERWAQLERAAQALLDSYAMSQGSPSPQTSESRRLLLDVIEAGPWTDAAWEAAALLSSPRR
jgi:predicted esterase